jgi:hypothetical protein
LFRGVVAPNVELSGRRARGSGHDRWRPCRHGEVGDDAELVGHPDAVDRLIEDARAGADVEVGPWSTQRTKGIADTFR